MKNRIIRNNLFYFSFDDFSHVMRIAVSLKCGDISGEILTRVVQKAALRYPYFSIRIIRHGESYDVEHNTDPIPVTHGTKPVLLGSDEANGQLIAVAYEHNKVMFDISHNLADGKGFLPWIKTVIYLYLTEFLGVELSSDGINLPGEEFLPGETDDPYENMDLENAECLLPDRKADNVFVPDMRYAVSEERSSYALTASVDDMMRLAGFWDGSPASMLAYITKEMIRELFPESHNKQIVCCMPYSYRALACGENNYHTQTLLLKIIYDDRYESMTMDRQLTCTRGTVMTQSDPDRVRYTLKQFDEYAAYLDDLPTIDERRNNYHKRLEMIDPETYAVSYLGRINWGSIEKYMDGITIESAAFSAPIMFAFVPIDGLFHITMVLNQTSDVYADTMVRLLNDHGVSAKYEYSFKQELCKIHMP